MHYDPLISSRSKALVSWGHDWVVLCLIVVHPFWAPTKVFALPIAARLYINRQGLTKGKKSKGKSRQDQGQEATPRPIPIIARDRNWPWNSSTWRPAGSPTMRSSCSATAPTVVEASCLICPPMFISSAMSIPRRRSTSRRLPRTEKTKGPARKKGDRLPGMAEWAADPKQPWTQLDFDQFGLHATLEVKTIQALYYKAGRDRLLTIVLVRDLEGKRPDQMFYCTKLDWTAREILSAYACRWAIECTFEYCKQFLGLEDPANRLPKAVERTAPMALFIYSLVVVWFHRTGHQFVRFPFRPGTRRRKNPPSPTC